MQLILDACAVIHLLQVDIEKENNNFHFNHDYLELLNKLEYEVIIVKKVHDEIKDNYKKNLISIDEKKLIESYINQNLYKLTSYDIFKEYEPFLPFVKRVNDYSDDNGELHSATYALYRSRYEDDSIFQTHFFTDDDGVKKDFNDFFVSNSLGQILETVDLLSVLYQKNFIKKKVIIDFAYNLKKLYVSEYNSLIDLCEKAKVSNGIKGTQEKALLTKLIELLNSINFTEISSQIIPSKEYISIKRANKELDILLSKVLSTDYKKVTFIDNKIQHLKNKMWDCELV